MILANVISPLFISRMILSKYAYCLEFFKIYYSILNGACSLPFLAELAFYVVAAG